MDYKRIFSSQGDTNTALSVCFSKSELLSMGVQELADLRVGDVRLEFPAQVKLTGKGRKTRSVPLMDKTTVLLKNYLIHH